MRFLKIIALPIALIYVLSCSGDVVEPTVGCETLEASYDINVRNIIDQTCAYNGCHDGSGGIGPGNYSTYDGLVRDLENGSFGDRVITRRDNPSSGMPPDKSVYPQSLQDSLSTTQLEIITCWLQGGFPK